MKNLIPIACIIIALIFAGCINDNDEKDEKENGNDKIPIYHVHENITVTIFWIGEEGNAENGYIPNIQSAWDDEWFDHHTDSESTFWGQWLFE